MWISQHPIVRLVYFQVLPLLQVCVQVNWERNPRNSGKLGGTRKSEASRTAVVALEDDSMITMTTKLADADFLAKEVKYHHSCRRTYLRRAERLAEGSKRSETSKLHEDAYGTLKMYITSTLVDNEGAELLTSLHARYMTILGSDESTYPARPLSANIFNTFPCASQQTKTSNKTGVIIYNASLTEESAISQACIAEHSIKESALHMGSLILGQIHSLLLH